MSKIFKISGNFTQYGYWSEPDPSFSGKIVVDDNDEFYGFCDELYASSMSEVNRVRYLAGAFAPNGKNGERGIAYYKLSNDRAQAPLMYVVPNLKQPDNGEWCALGPSGYFVPQGHAKVILEEETYSEKEEKSIKEKYEALDKNINGNGELIEQIYCCKDILTHAK